jgi:putative flippase GtrA/glycosyltransferase involved in cell wall biosynthesis
MAAGRRDSHHRQYGAAERVWQFFATWVVGYYYLIWLGLRLKLSAIAQAMLQLVRIIKFAGVGITVAIIGYGLLYTLVSVIGLPPGVAYLIDAAVSVELNFLGSRYITWRDRRGQAGFWRSWAYFHGARGITFGINQGLFNLQTWLFARWPAFFDFTYRDFNYGYLLANTACIIVSTSFNYTANDEFVFAKRKSGIDDYPTARLSRPEVRVVIPCRNSPVGRTVEAVLNQDYIKANMARVQIILVGSPDDTSWDDLPQDIHLLRGYHDRLIRIVEVRVHSPGRDSNAKRDIGLRLALQGLVRARKRLIWFLDADVEPPPHELSLIIDRTLHEGYAIVAGTVPSREEERTRFWPLFIDTVGGKTPYWPHAYTLTLKNLGLNKMPVTANLAFQAEVALAVGGPAVEFTNSYEDYEWLLRMLMAGYHILCDPALAAPREHRVGFRRLLGEYVRSGLGSMDFILRHVYNLFRTWQLLRMNAIPWVLALVIAASIVVPAATLVLGIALVLSRILGTLLRARRLYAIVYPFIGFFFAACHVFGNCRRLYRRGRKAPLRPHVGMPKEYSYHIRSRREGPPS